MKMFDLNELCVMAYENAAKREAKDGKVSTDTMQMFQRRRQKRLNVSFHIFTVWII